MQISRDFQMELVVFIVNANEGDRVMHLAEETGTKGGTVFHGTGTTRKGLLSKLGLDIIKKEILLIVALESQAAETLDYVAQKKKMQEKNRGIGFRLPLRRALGVLAEEELNEQMDQNEEKENTSMHQGIVVIVNRGGAEEVMDYAQEAGAQGGTIIQARGAGSKEAKKIFNMDIVPEKEMLIIISEKQKTKEIVEKLSQELNIAEPNKGIIFVIDLTETRGIQ
ncbi:P-II family nitrogen regulator [Marinilactibacillus piezotolerans]|uniref:P-II family nitrogen regulator n=1 Tax=Marinilactibacillus piezotolerans TaxID=258723 RepID=UPI0009B1404D|nr:P-II family nitrogen regulator [Marinilactibacillus piezotolerans]